MNRQEADILNLIRKGPYINQRQLAQTSHYSLGIVNRCLKNLISEGYLCDNMDLSEKGKLHFQQNKPQNAIILAAGFGMRMVPINMECPKALLEIHGETLIERMIRFLREVGIEKITVVVGFLKEQFEYLLDSSDVKLVINEEYGTKNNLHSLSLVAEQIDRTYIIPSDVWCKNNPFSENESYSWYMVSDQLSMDSPVRVNRKQEIVKIGENEAGEQMIGIAYLMGEKAKILRERLKAYRSEPMYHNAFWETCLYENSKLILPARVLDSHQVVEINTYEQLRELDEDSNHLQSEAMEVIQKALGVSVREIRDIQVLKKGMTNRSFMFNCQNKSYIMRIPGVGTDHLINRRQEAQVYLVLSGKGICDDVVYINWKNGYKITEYLTNYRVCDPHNLKDLNVCMKKLRDFHSMNLWVDHEFNLFEKINFYESLWSDSRSIYRDYERTKANIFSLQDYINDHITHKCLTHIDAICDNFLFTQEGDIRLIDWEYAGMQDPHVDIAMFCIYSLYSRAEVDQLIDIYFEGDCPLSIRIKIYAYISVCGLLWSNWCEYKRGLGIEFGEYALRQYRYAKEYYKIVKELLDEGR